MVVWYTVGFRAVSTQLGFGPSVYLLLLSPLTSIRNPSNTERKGLCIIHNPLLTVCMNNITNLILCWNVEQWTLWLWRPTQQTALDKHYAGPASAGWSLSKPPFWGRPISNSGLLWAYDITSILVILHFIGKCPTRNFVKNVFPSNA